MIRFTPALLAATLCLALQAQPGPACGHPWWQHAVFYELYPRSFQDSNGDGVGDLNGITSRLDYLRDLGVDALWLTPCFPSPQVDFGYDISDYRDIDPLFGNLADFDRLVAEGRRRGLRVLLDLVLNHTSDQHPWFQEARASRESPKRDWYVWRDGKAGRPPNNWLSLFGGPAWTLDPATGQYYYHFFYPQQPDLNWRNPEVVSEMLDMTRFWFRRGVAGFRLDAIDTLFEDPELRDNPVLPGLNDYGDPNMTNLRNYKQPEEHRLMRELRKTADEFGGVLIGETYVASARELRAYYGANGDELQLPTGHLLAMAPRLSAADFRRRIAAQEAAGGWPVWVLGNHDLARLRSRYGGRGGEGVAKVLGALLLTLRGTPILYYGDELGMTNHDPSRKEDVRDPGGRNGWPKAKLRDGERTPMQWDAGPGAGFTAGTPWLPVAPGAEACNVDTETRAPDSVLNVYRALLALRRGNRVLLDGDYRPLEGGDPHLLSYLRVLGNEAILVVLNLSGEKRRLALPLGGKAWQGPGTRLLFASSLAAQGPGLPREVGPYGALLFTLQAPKEATRSLSTPGVPAATSPVVSQASPPCQSEMRPPASVTSSAPAAKSHLRSPISKKPS